tara:strand:- start:40 stop:171 length:132 start_codon:yes stop_codon:yes gene_type:complete
MVSLFKQTVIEFVLPAKVSASLALKSNRIRKESFQTLVKRLVI